ncbi:TrmB family transcriptional regulator [Archaeoglobales archaeon]|nr:MAG: TrmB family transcriptional regulator [Archaeoglobales archaeon]
MKSIKEVIIRLNCDNVLECFYGLNEADIQVFNVLRRLNSARIDVLSRELGKGENSIYKSLQKMMVAGLVTREKKILDDGGYYYLYSVENTEKIASEMNSLLDRWYYRMKKVIQEFIEMDKKESETELKLKV